MATLASDLHALLRVAHVPGPYVLAGHSVGGTYALIDAAQYPRQVAGVALIDSATPYQFDLPDYPGFYRMWKRASALLPAAARTAMGRMELRSGFGSLPARARDAARAFNSTPRQLTASRIEFLQLPAVFNQAKALRSLRGKPLAVLSATVGQMRGRAAAQDRLARLSTNSVHRRVANATHAALLEDETFVRERRARRSPRSFSASGQIAPANDGEIAERPIGGSAASGALPPRRRYSCPAARRTG